MRQSEDNRVLQTARAHFKAVVAKRVRDGDPAADVHLFEMPWSCRALGTPLTQMKKLRLIGPVCLSEGVRNYFTHNDSPIHWIESAEQLRQRFLAELIDQQGRFWGRFQTALKAAWEGKLSSEFHRDAYGDPSLMDYYDGVQKNVFRENIDHGAEQTWSVGVNKARRALQDAWSEVFRSGRVLVFGQDKSGWTFMPPFQWSDAPPVTCLTVDVLEQEWARQTIDEIECTNEQSEKRIIHGVNRISDSPAANLHRLQIRAHLTNQFAKRRPKKVSAERKYAFLLSRDIPDETAFVQLERLEARKSPVKKHKTGRPSLDEYDAPIIKEIMVRRRKGEFKTIHQAVVTLFWEKPDIFHGENTSDESKIRRLRRKLTAVWT